MGVPLFDTASVMWIRYRHGAPLMVGDRNHFSHRLIALGFSVRQAAVAIGLLTGAIGLLALPLRRLSAPAAIVHLLALALLFTVIGAIEHVGGRRGESPARPKGDA
jgi:UDP-GlcNAc:undecaprenyl-phosphate GlcNAc-1-phosphate transferase